MRNRAAMEGWDGTGWIKVAVTSTGAIQTSGGSAGGGDGAILDGVSSAIKATVLDYTNANPIAVRLTDTAGDYIAAGAGTQYTEADTDASITGTAMLWEDAADTLRAVSAAKPLPVGDAGGSITVDGTVAATQSGAWNVTDVSGTVSLPTGAATAANQLPDGHNVTVDNAAGVAAVNIQDGGNTITVDGSVTANAGTNLNTSALALEAGGNLAGAATSLAVIDDWDEADRAKVNPIVGQAGIAAGTGIDGVTVPRVTLATNVPLPAGTNNIGDVDVLTLPNVTIGTMAALVAGTANIGDVDIASIAAGDTNIGNVDIVTMPNVTLAAGTNTNEVVGDVAHSATAAGNPVLNAGISQDTDDTAPPNRVDAEGDATRLATDRDGTLFVRTHGPQVWSYHENSSSALTDTSIHAAPGAGLSCYVTDIVCSTGAATAFNIFFEEGASTVLGPYYLEAVAGRGFAIHFSTPKKITANTALTVTTSAAIAHSIDVTGFTAQG